jgi:hypothetical protein
VKSPLASWCLLGAFCLVVSYSCGCSSDNARRAANLPVQKSYSEALDECIANAQDGGPPYSLCEERVDAMYRGPK